VARARDERRGRARVQLLPHPAHREALGRGGRELGGAARLEHVKRYEDVADVLGAGIDVYSTVNVQHLESLNDKVADLTGVRVRETFPDSVLARADEVVLVDLTPPDLIERLRAGKVYPAA
jgi:two-component system sensor histidine kinase KdpD